MTYLYICICDVEFTENNICGRGLFAIRSLKFFIKVQVSMIKIISEIFYLIFVPIYGSYFADRGCVRRHSLSLWHVGLPSWHLMRLGSDKLFPKIQKFQYKYLIFSQFKYKYNALLFLYIFQDENHLIMIIGHMKPGWSRHITVVFCFSWP